MPIHQVRAATPLLPWNIVLKPRSKIWRNHFREGGFWKPPTTQPPLLQLRCYVELCPPPPTGVVQVLAGLAPMASVQAAGGASYGERRAASRWQCAAILCPKHAASPGPWLSPMPRFNVQTTDRLGGRAFNSGGGGRRSIQPLWLDPLPAPEKRLNWQARQNPTETDPRAPEVIRTQTPAKK